MKFYAIKNVVSVHGPDATALHLVGSRDKHDSIAGKDVTPPRQPGPIVVLVLT